MARRKRQALSRIANLSGDGGATAKRRKTSTESGKENQPVRVKQLRHIRMHY
jgi:hypothetical protein